MNNIQEADWAEESWHSHTGMDSNDDYCFVEEEKKKEAADKSAEKKQEKNKDGQ